MNKENAFDDLRQIADGAARHIQALKALKRPTDSWDDLLVYLLSSKLDAHTTRDWQRSLVGDALPTFKQFLDFVSQQCHVLESDIIQCFRKKYNFANPDQQQAKDIV